MGGEATRHWQGCWFEVCAAPPPPFPDLVPPVPVLARWRRASRCRLRLCRGLLAGGGPSLSMADEVSGCRAAALWWELWCSWAVLAARVRPGSLGRVGGGVAGARRFMVVWRWSVCAGENSLSGGGQTVGGDARGCRPLPEDAVAAAPNPPFAPGENLDPLDRAMAALRRSTLPEGIVLELMCVDGQLGSSEWLVHG